ncbi:MAG: BRCT domain-containing protein, partial [Myxococcales bacterium]
GKTVVITGELDAFSREAAAEAAERAGARVGGSVSRRTDFLVVGRDPGRTKLEKAEALGVERIDEAEFLRRLSGDAAHAHDGAHA